jgi:hypothetical protein
VYYTCKCTLRARSSFQCALHTVLPQRAATAATIRTELWLRRFGKRVDTPASLQQLSSPLPQSNTINLSQRQASLTGFIKFFMDQAQLKISFICDLLQGRAQKAASVAPSHLVPLITAIHRFLLLGLGPGSFKFLSWSMREVFWWSEGIDLTKCVDHLGPQKWRSGSVGIEQRR